MDGAFEFLGKNKTKQELMSHFESPFELALRSVSDAHRQECTQWRQRVLELERQTEQLTAENTRLRAQVRTLQNDATKTTATSSASNNNAPDPLDLELARCHAETNTDGVTAVPAARVVVVGDSLSAPMFVMPTPPRNKAVTKRTVRAEPIATDVDVVNLSDDDDDDDDDDDAEDRSRSTKTVLSAALPLQAVGAGDGSLAKRARTSVAHSIVDVAVASSAAVAGDIDLDDNDLRLPSQMPPRVVSSPVVVVPVDFKRGKEDALQNRTTTGDAPPSKPFRYVEPVLNRDERRKLVGRECEQCAEFYTAVCEATGRAPDRDAFVQAHSRHREVCTPPPRTPEGFWTVGFASQESVRSDATTQEK
jgi:hypothetical protein